MKFTQEIIIDKPIAMVVKLFDDPSNMQKWMEGLTGFEHISGQQGQPGAKSKLKFIMGKREIEMIETIITRNLPSEFSGSYETNGVVNYVSNKFESVSETSTRYITENSFEFSGFMKMLSWIMPGAFKKQSYKYMVNFKDFVENQS